MGNGKAIQWYLEQWGIWQRGGLPDMATSDRHTTRMSPDVTDDELLGLDRKIAHLKMRDYMKYLVIECWYCRQFSDERIGRELHVSRVTALGMRKQAESWLDGALCTGISADAS